MLSDEVLSYFTSRNFEQVAPPVDDLLIHLIDSGAATVTINVTPSETGGAQSREWGKVIRDDRWFSRILGATHGLVGRCRTHF